MRITANRSGARGRRVGVSTGAPAPILDMHAGALMLVVLLLTTGVIAMHSFGASHHAGASATFAHFDGAPSGAMTSHTEHEAMVLAPMSTWLTGHPDASECAPCFGSGSGKIASIEGSEVSDHGLLAICLAVIPLLVLLLRLGWMGWFCLFRHLSNRSRPAMRTEPNRSFVTSMSLSRLCVLRT